MQLQEKIDAWHKANPGSPDMDGYKSFLKEIGYLVPEGPAFEVATANIDPEIGSVAGPQLVVPVMNARYALNAANARWGSLYDALYGTDAMGSKPAGKGFDPGARRGGDRLCAQGSRRRSAACLQAAGRTCHRLCHPGRTARHLRRRTVRRRCRTRPIRRLFRRHRSALQGAAGQSNGLHLEIDIDGQHPIGKTDKAHIADVILESAMSTIMDCEDSVAAVDAEDKVVVYSNWLGLMKGDLEETFEKGGETITRRMNGDRQYTAPDGSLPCPCMAGHCCWCAMSAI